MADGFSNDWTFVEHKKKQELHQDKQNDRQKKPAFLRYCDQLNSQTEQYEQSTGNDVNGWIVMPDVNNVELDIKNVDLPQLKEPEYSYIGFNRAAVFSDKSDNMLMKEMRAKLKTYFENKETYDKQSKRMEFSDRSDVLEKCMTSLAAIQDLCEQYRQSSLTLNFKKQDKQKAKEAEQKLKEISELSSKVSAEMEKMSSTYFTAVEDEFSALGKQDAKLKKRFQEMFGEAPGENSINVKKDKMLNLDEWNKEFQLSDHEQKSAKDYLRFRCRIEGKKIASNPDHYNKTEQDLWNLIGEYSKIEDIGRQVSGNKKDKKEIGKYLSIQQREYDLYKAIREGLGKVLKDKGLAPDKKEMFMAVQKMIVHDTEGTLEYPKDKILDCTGIKTYRITNIKKDEMTDLAVEPVDRTKDPLFAHVPCLSDISQDLLGNCYLLASIADVVAESPETITGMFKDEGKNAVVRLYHRKTVTDPENPSAGAKEIMEPVYIRIKKTFDKKISQGALWVNLLCKAYAVYIQTYDLKSFYGNSVEKSIKMMKDRKSLDDPRMLDYGFINNGGTGMDALPILTGKVSSQQMAIGGQVFKAGDPKAIITEEYKKKRITFDTSADLTQQYKFKDQKTAVFEYNKATYIYHKDSHKGLIPSKKPKWNDGDRISYLMNFSVGADIILNEAKSGLELHEVLKEPKVVEKKIRELKVNDQLNSIIAFCQVMLQKAGNDVNPTVIFDRLKDDAIRTLKEGCESAKRMTKEEEKKSEFFTGEYTDEALAAYKKILEMKSKGLMIIANTRSNLGKKKSLSGKETEGVGVVSTHGYSVLGVKKMKYNGKTVLMVRVRNPWGHYTTSYRRNSKGKIEAVTEQRADNGEFLMELTHFVQNVSAIEGTAV